MWRSLRGQLTLIFFAFFVLVASSVMATFWLVRTQHNDATVINLAGRQRMLTQQMTRLALTQPDNPTLVEVERQFEQTLHILRDGGTVMDANGRFVSLPPATNPAIHAQLDQAIKTWGIFQQTLQTPDDISQLLAESDQLLQQLDQIVSAFEAEAQAKTVRLRQIQTAFLISAFLLLGWGYIIIRRHLLHPLDVLGKTAQRIGEGNLSHPVPEVVGQELGQLGQTMEQMRIEIAATQELLEQRVAQRTHELIAAFEFSQEITHQLDLTPLLQSVARRARDLLDGKAASVCILKGNGRYLELAATSGGPDHLKKKTLGKHHPTQQGIALSVIQQGQTVTIQDGCTQCGFLHQFPGHPCIATPLQLGGQVLGALCVVRPQTPYGPEESRALTLLANAAAIAIDNARLLETTKKQAETNATLAERERLAAELHDNLAQTLGFLNLKLERVEELLTTHQTSQAIDELTHMETAVKTAFTQVRAALTGLQHPLPNHQNFTQKLSECISEFRQTTNLPVELTIEEQTTLTLPEITQNQCLHIIREALINAQKHAQAQHISIRIRQENDIAQFIIQDDGRGFNPTQVEQHNHLGLKIMHNRAERCGGKLTINTAPSKGTQIIASFPLNKEDIEK
ncbi:MAG: HAMP domain-containing protein [Chloroflexi bacterium]|nr:MAG: HAMP domain-containing protein [Chloroflexota bacterium]